MGTSASENIALHIGSTNDLRAVREARTETTALGQAAQQATDQAAASQSKLTASIDQVRRAQAAANGDFEVFKQKLAEIVQAETNLANAAARTTQEMQKQAASGRVVGSIGPQLGPAYGFSGKIGPQLGPALPTTRLAEEIEKSNAALEKMPPRLRTAGNSIGLLAAAAATGSGSLSGLATAAGNVVQGMAMMSTSATVAASAAGIGALIAAVGVLIGVAIEAKRALADLPTGLLNSAMSEHINNLKTVKQIDAEIAMTEQRRAAMAEQLGRGDQDALQANANLGAQIEALYRRRVALVNELREKEADEAKAAAERAKQRAKEEAALAKAANDHLFALRNAAAAEGDKATQTEFEARRRAIEREAAEEIRKNDELVQSDSMRQQALDAINDKKRYSLQLLQKEIDLAKEKQVKEGLQGYAKLSQAATLHGSIVVKVAQAAAEAVRKYEILVQAKKDAVLAKSEWAAAMAAFAKHDYPGGALHLVASAGYAASAVAGGAAAVGGSAGGGGAPGVSDSGTTFQPNEGGGAGAQTIVLQTVNPFSKEVIGEAIYQINRAGVLKRPIPIAPTSGLAMAGA
jgi:hypothetical protein